MYLGRNWKTLLKKLVVEDYSIFLDEETNISLEILKVEDKLKWMNYRVIL
jgi:L-rhamnose mutarotase